jgi:hypothetical protein
VEYAVIPAKAGIQFFCNLSAKLDHAPLLRRALRASFAVRFGIRQLLLRCFTSAVQPTLE